MKPLHLVFILALFFSSCQEEKVIFVADHYGSCEEQCLLIRENKNDEWTKLTDEIEGFKYEEGYSYQLKVLISNKKGTDKEATLTYKLIEVIAKIKTEEASSASIDDGKRWHLLQLEGFENNTNKTPYFSIEAGRISGNAGCNAFNGNILLNDEGLFSAGRIQTTRMYCEEYMGLEKAFLSALSKAKDHKINGDVINVYNEKNELLFVASQQEPELTLDNTWYITSLKGFANKTTKTPFFTIKDGQINGNNGCNSFGGEINTDTSGKFEIGMLRATKMYCLETAELEKSFMTALGSAASYKITDKSLFLLDKSSYILISATTDQSIITEMNMASKPFVIEYNTYSKEHKSIRNKVDEANNMLEFYELRPKTDPQQKTLSKSELTFFKDALSTIDVSTLENLDPPSTNYKNGSVAGASIIVSYKGEIHRTQTFDHGNPPEQIKKIVEKIMELRSE